MGALRRPATYVGAVKEVSSLLRCASRYPGGMVSMRPGRAPASGGGAHATPVLLIHGYGHNHSGWWVLRSHLKAAGFGTVETFDYSPVPRDIPSTARRLGDAVERLRRRTGADKVHIVGHSLGGLLARWYVQELDGADSVDTVVTLGTPHEGTWAAWVAPGRTAAELRPGSWVVDRLNRHPRVEGVRWVAFYSNVDYLVQPPRSAMIRQPGLNAVNILAKDHGHVSLILSPRVARAVVQQLQAAEGVAGMGTLASLPVAASTPPASAQVSEASSAPAAAVSGVAAVAAGRGAGRAP
ncbi:MAG TPA: alpha/beta fold hydrolase [Acidimicrobiales bacterium]|nr:alpha/beta fold hydrolase [Acidimicrobiales bacterium]